ncbi:uncharacterized protein METZ01_LOCUS256648 [marine metagenome]|uniref:Uncharacterized protein n=1 Tax=marine metagenome TaxID=408172 RepID=A0A382IVD3_9ZZZZ
MIAFPPDKIIGSRYESKRFSNFKNM